MFVVAALLGKHPLSSDRRHAHQISTYLILALWVHVTYSDCVILTLFPRIEK